MRNECKIRLENEIRRKTTETSAVRIGCLRLQRRHSNNEHVRRRLLYSYRSVLINKFFAARPRAEPLAVSHICFLSIVLALWYLFVLFYNSLCIYVTQQHANTENIGYTGVTR